MAGGRRKTWRALCIAALDARDPDELLQILQELNRVLKHEEQVRHDFRHATNTVGRSEDTREHRPARRHEEITSNRVPNEREIPRLAATNDATDSVATFINRNLHGNESSWLLIESGAGRAGGAAE